jgi:hypothetical protein
LVIILSTLFACFNKYFFCY